MHTGMIYWNCTWLLLGPFHLRQFYLDKQLLMLKSGTWFPETGMSICGQIWIIEPVYWGDITVQWCCCSFTEHEGKATTLLLAADRSWMVVQSSAARLAKRPRPLHSWCHSVTVKQSCRLSTRNRHIQHSSCYQCHLCNKIVRIASNRALSSTRGKTGSATTAGPVLAASKGCCQIAPHPTWGMFWG